jgi:hypothetical protein
MGLSLCSGPDGKPGGDLMAGLLDRKEKYTWVPLLNLEDINTLRTGDANLRHLRFFCITTVKDR